MKAVDESKAKRMVFTTKYYENEEEKSCTARFWKNFMMVANLSKFSMS